MALITGGMSGLGMMAAYEHALAGRERIVAVTRSPHMTPGEQEAHLLDVIQDIATHYIVRCDIGDAGAWSDVIAFAGNISPHDENDPQSTMKDSRDLLKAMDSMDVIDVLVASLRGMIEAGAPIEAAKLNRVLYFRNNMSRGLKEAMEKHRSTPIDKDMEERLFMFQDCLRELSELIELFRKRGLVEEGPTGGDAGPEADLFSAETSATGPLLGAPSANGRTAGQRKQAADKQPPEATRDSLLEMMEKELSQKQARKPGPTSFVEELGMTSMPGQAPKEQPPVQKTKAATELQRACEVCGAKCAASAARCSGCQRTSERGSLQGAIQRAKEQALLKKQQEEERKARREQAEREEKSKAREAAERKSREEQEQRSRAAAMEKARDAAAQRAQAEAERRAKEEKEVAAAMHAEHVARDEAAKRKSLDDIVCSKGHVLTVFPVQRGFPCDICDAEAVDGDIMWGCRHKNDRDCRTCDFDICARCSKSMTRRALQAQGKKV